ncbi:MAG: hypothetical protein KGI46_05440, partial [Alphaproteobacteria bacterium]|nr:hypothetical protein [Alphaproteobacteria bacterium]
MTHIALQPTVCAETGGFDRPSSWAVTNKKKRRPDHRDRIGLWVCLQIPGVTAVPCRDAARGLAMVNLVQYRCYFLDSTGSIGSDEMIECREEQDAVETA